MLQPLLRWITFNINCIASLNLLPFKLDFMIKNLLGAWEGFCALQIHALLSLELRLAALHFEAGKHEIDLNALTILLSYISTASNLTIKNRALTLGKIWGTLNLGQKQ